MNLLTNEQVAIPTAQSSLIVPALQCKSSCLPMEGACAHEWAMAEQISQTVPGCAWGHAENLTSPPYVILGWVPLGYHGALYPESNGTYVFEGASYNISCDTYTPTGADINAHQCPSPKLAYPPGAAGPVPSDDYCVWPCPLPIYSSDEYYTIWLCSVVPGILGIMLNSLLLLTFVLGGAELRRATHTRVKTVVLLCFVYCCLDVVPTVTMFQHHQLACGVPTGDPEFGLYPANYATAGRLSVCWMQV
jgi:hypothetical protein